MSLFKIPRTSQPQGAVGIDWSNPITRGLVRCIIPCGNDFIDLVTCESLTKVNGNSQSVVTKGGRGLKNTNEDSYWTFPVRAETPNSFTAAWVGSVQGGTVPIVLRDFTNSSGTILFWHYSGQWRQRIGGTDQIVAGATTLDVVYSAVATGSPSAAALYVDGVTFTTGGAGSGSFSSPWCLHRNGDNPGSTLATTLLLVVWDRAISQTEARQHSANPWQIFSPIEKPIFVRIAEILEVVPPDTLETNLLINTSSFYPASISLVLPTLARPVSDTSQGNWTPSTAGSLASKVNEVTPSDAEFISVTTLSTCEVLLNETYYPGGGAQVLRYRASSENHSTLTVTLKQGSTTIMTRTHALTPTIVEYVDALTAPEIATIIAGPISVTLTSS